ncbi:MAG: DNA topoisomerase IB [Acidobacteriota bacterium]|nr:DNA topoisomerase IB [Acidobacteriota bacterium]
MSSFIKLRPRRKSALPADPQESARVAGLRYTLAEGPGIVRKRAGKAFSYIGPDGKAIRDREELKRIRALVIPPAWSNVWICPLKHGHLQAVGRDARGRKQYRYHPVYRFVRDQTKFQRMIAFGEALPVIRKRMHEDLQLANMPKNKVLATLLKLLETTRIRIGNEEYAKTNDSYGLTTMREDHVEVSGYKLRFQFRGKSGLQHDIELADRRLAKIVRDCQCIPGEELFHYIDPDGQICKIYSEDVNNYLREITAQDFTAKDFRTWAGTGQAAVELESIGPSTSETEAKKNVVAAIKAVAAKLGNKPSTCRKYYVHPVVLDSYVDGSLFDFMKKAADSNSSCGLRREEACVLDLVSSRQSTTVVNPTKAA